MTGPPYGRDVARWEREHPDWRAGPGLEGHGWSARRIDGRGIPHGPVVAARTLDELADRINGIDNPSVPS